jgi:hypothetical protein
MDQLRHYLAYFLERPQLGSFEDVVHEAVASTIFELQQDAHTPFQRLDDLEEFLTEEAWDALRKMTYGCLNLQDFRARRAPKP